MAQRAELGPAAGVYYVSAAALVACYALVVRRSGEHPSRKKWTALIAVPVNDEMACSQK